MASFHYLKCALASLPCEQWLTSDNLVARLNLPNMQWPPEQKIHIYAQAVRGLLSLEPSWDKRSKYLDFIDIYTGLTDNERQQYEQQYPEETTQMAGFAERFREEGMEQGMQQGVRTGECLLLQRQLTRRFGTLGADVLARLEAAGTDELETWGERILDAQSLDDVFQ